MRGDNDTRLPILQILLRSAVAFGALCVLALGLVWFLFRDQPRETPSESSTSASEPVTVYPTGDSTARGIP